MLRLKTASSPNTNRAPRVGLALAGGGPLGAIYELGVLRALEDTLSGVKLTRLDAYVGVSSGALMAASLANDIAPTELGRIFINTASAEQPFKPERFLRPAVREYVKRVGRAPGAAWRAIREFTSQPLDWTLPALGQLAELAPTGLFDNDSIDRYLRGIFTVPGRCNDFRDLDANLFIVAVDLDTGSSVRFGEPGWDHVPISKAVQASAALPGLYPPVEIDDQFFVDGALRRTLHASVALDQDLDLLIGINPLVPYDGGESGQRKKRSLAKGGLPMVLSQTFRAIIQSRMEIGIEKYMDKYPASHLLLIEPDRNDEVMFFSNVFSYADRRELCEHAYQQARDNLRSNQSAIDAALGSYGITLDLERLNDPDRTFRTALAENRPRSALGTRLDRILDRLQESLPAA